MAIKSTSKTPSKAKKKKALKVTKSKDITTPERDNTVAVIHLQSIGKRFYHIRRDLGLSMVYVEEALKLPKQAVARFESGKGIHIMNLLKIINWLESMDYNINWLMSFDNTEHFMKNKDVLSLYSNDIDKSTLNKKSALTKLNKVSEELKSIESIIHTM